MEKLKRIPQVGEKLHFFDDGKVSDSRHYIAEVVRIVPYEQKIIVDRYNYELDRLIPYTLQSIHKDEVDDHRQSKNFIVYTRGAGTNPGDPWLFAEKTDYFIECSIPEYDDNNIWFARAVDGGWFSMDIQNSWQGGELDIDGEKYQEMVDEGYEYSTTL